MLFQNRTLFARHGIHIMVENGTANFRKFSAACMADGRFDDYVLQNALDDRATHAQFYEQFLQEFHNEIKGLGQDIHTVILSGEHLSSSISTSGEVAHVHAILAPLFNNIRVICYLRDQVSLYAASYTQSLKSGQATGFGDPVAACNPTAPFFNHALMLQNWAESFGKSALDIRLFLRGEWLSGDLIDDFLKDIDPDLAGKIKRADINRNPSLNHHGQMLLRAINQAVPTQYGRLNHVRYNLIKICETHFCGAGQFPTPDEQAQIYEAFKTSNAQIAQDYLGRADDLFAPPAYDVGLMPIEPDFITAIATLLSALVQEDTVILPGLYTDIFRDAATQLESQDLELSFKLMHLASIMRPAGATIQQKMKEYNARLADKDGL